MSESSVLYKRVLLKLSGEALMGDLDYGIQPEVIKRIAGEIAEIRALGRRVGKPVLVTEIGYASQATAAHRPWDDTAGDAVNLGVQQRLYRGFCDAFAKARSLSGFYVWNWFGFGGPRDAGFTPRGKPAAAELAKCFARTWPASAVVGNES